MLPIRLTSCHLQEGHPRPPAGYLQSPRTQAGQFTEHVIPGYPGARPGKELASAGVLCCGSQG